MSDDKQPPVYYGVLPSGPPCYVILCACVPEWTQNVILMLDERREAWRGTCGHCGREHWADDAGGA